MDWLVFYGTTIDQTTNLRQYDSNFKIQSERYEKKNYLLQQQCAFPCGT